MADKIIRQHRLMRCEKCGETFPLEHRAYGTEDEDGTLRLSLPMPCAKCGYSAKHAVAGKMGWHGDRADKGARIQTTMRFDQATYEFIGDLAHETGLSMADLINEMLAPYANDRKGLTQEIVNRLRERQE